MVDRTPEQIGRSHALQRLAECAETLARTRGSGEGLEPADAAYTRAYAETCRNFAERVRQAKGFEA
jgi:hypothetical protein